MKLKDLVAEPCIVLDVAHFQGAAIPWDACKALGVRAVIIKWWHGPWRNNPAVAEQQYREAKAAGLLVGRYAWWVPSAGIDRQIAAWTSDDWPDDDLPLSIDLEDPSAPKGPVTLHDCERLVLGVEAAKRTPIQYSGGWWADPYLGHASEVLASRPYWHAAYPRKAAKGSDYAGALAEWLEQTAPTLPRIWANSRPVAWQLDGTDDATGTGALRLPNGVDVDVNIGDWAALTALVPAYHRDTDPAPWDPTPPALRLHPDEVPALEDVLASLADDDPTHPQTPTSKSQQMAAVKET